jgi:hypothetical protein
MSRRSLVLVLALSHLALLTGCQSNVTVLEKWMTGSFSSAEQHQADPDNYYDIRLQMVSIWPGRTDGPWLYVEQAAATSLDQPYRQRVYRLVAHADGTVHSVIYRFAEDPIRYAGAWREPERLADLTPDDLVILEGCDMVLTRRDDRTFVGGTVGTQCANTWRGASYATSQATVTETALTSWDRGYDAEDRQIWGATKGGYIFEKRSATTTAP